MSGDPHAVEPDAGVSTTELFFDLIFVFAVTRTSELLQAEPGWWGALRALVVFVPVFWLWVGTTMFANLSDADAVPGRFTFFGVALSGLAMALALPEAFGDRGLLFALAYWFGRVVLLTSVARHPHRQEFITFPVGALATGPLLVLGALLPDGIRLAVWGAVAVVELGTPRIRRRAVAGTPFRVAHLADRYGTFVIIALGETVVATGAAAAELGNPWLEVTSASFGLAVGGVLWWTYFDLAAPAIEHGLARSETPIEVIRPVLSYGHLAFVAGIIAVAAGIGGAVRDPLAPLSVEGAALVLGGAALFLATFGLTRWRLFHSVAIPRLCGAVACCVLVAAAPHVPALVVLGALVAVLAAVNVADHLRARRPLATPGWRP